MQYVRGAIKKFSTWPSSVQNEIKIVMLLIVASLKTQHAQFDFWATNILCMWAYEHSVCQMGVEMLTPELCTSFWRTSRTIPTLPSNNLFHNSLFEMKRGSTTSILSYNNKACKWTNESIKIVISLHCVNKKAVLSQKLPRDARYISRPWAVVEIWPFEIIQEGGSRHLEFIRIENSAIRSAGPENPTL